MSEACKTKNLRAVVVLMLFWSVGLPQMVSGATGTPSGALVLPKIDAPQSLSLKERAKFEKEL